MRRADTVKYWYDIEKEVIEQYPVSAQEARATAHPQKEARRMALADRLELVEAEMREVQKAKAAVVHAQAARDAREKELEGLDRCRVELQSVQAGARCAAENMRAPGCRPGFAHKWEEGRDRRPGRVIYEAQPKWGVAPSWDLGEERRRNREADSGWGVSPLMGGGQTMKIERVKRAIEQREANLDRLDHEEEHLYPGASQQLNEARELAKRLMARDRAHVTFSSSS